MKTCKSIDDILTVGNEFDFYGVDGQTFKLDNWTLGAIEDPSDGYRSYLDCVVITSDPDAIFFDTPLDRIRIEDEGDGYKLVSTKDGHKWMAIS
jgi:hypothetical protein